MRHAANVATVRRAGWTAYLAWQMRGQARLPFRSPEALRRLQSRRTRAMVTHAWRTVPYYRETMDRLGLSPADFRTADDLARLPLLAPADIQRDPEYYLSRRYRPEQCLRLRTGGSTGQPRTIFHAPVGVLRNAAHGERERSILAEIVGRRFGYRETVIAPPDVSIHPLQAYIHARLLMPRRLPIRRQHLLLTAAIEENLRAINVFRPDVVHCFGSYLDVLFPHLLETGAEFHRPKAVTYSSDAASDAIRRIIMEDFGVPVFSTYQANEALKLGFECQAHRGLHLNVDLYPLRIVDADGRTLDADRSGQVVVSNLVNPATVLLNYRLGDVATRLSGTCPCGRSLPMLSFPAGRTDEMVTLTSGRLIHPQAVRYLLSFERRIWQYQVVQHTPRDFQVRVVAAGSANREVMARRIAKRFARQFGRDVRARVEFVDAIPRTAGGKVRPIICLCRGEASAEEKRA